MSLYPREYMTNAGEYLLSLPQHLEALGAGAEEGAGEEDGEEGGAGGAAGTGAAAGELDAEEWMSRVAEAAADLLVAEVRAIASLSDAGAAQLAVKTTRRHHALSPSPPPRVCVCVISGGGGEMCAQGGRKERGESSYISHAIYIYIYIGLCFVLGS